MIAFPNQLKATLTGTKFENAPTFAVSSATQLQRLRRWLAMSEPDPDVARWGLHLLDVDQLFSSNYYGDTSHHDVYISHEQYSRDYRNDMDTISIENDEIIAYTLQEELSQMSLAEGTEYSNAGDTWQTGSATQDQSVTPWSHYDSHENNLQEKYDVGHSSSCSSPEESHDGEDLTYNLQITDESDLDGEVGKRLYEMIPVPHVPRTNGDIPSIDEATSDHQRLLDRLQLYNLIECKVEGDGNCQFRALSDQFYRSPEHHKFVRRQIINQLKLHPDMYEGYVPMAYGEYLKKMSKNGEWGDHITLQAASDSYGLKIFVLTSFKDTCSIEILPKVQMSKRVIFLSFWAEVHYNSIYPEGEVPEGEHKRRKGWSLFGNKH